MEPLFFRIGNHGYRAAWDNLLKADASNLQSRRAAFE